MRTKIIEILQKKYPQYCLKHIDTANEILCLKNSLSAQEISDMANRFIQNIMDNGWDLNSDEQIKLTDAYINSILSEF